MPLTITIPASEQYDAETNCFYQVKEQTLTLEHSLVSISKWEQKWNKPFLSDAKGVKTAEQILDYVRCMTINSKEVDPRAYYCLTPKQIEEITKYIEAPMTATWFSEDKSKTKPSREIVTSEVIYGWMINLGVWQSCEKWHINRLLTLIRVINTQNTPNKKMSKNELLRRNRSLNEARRKAIHTKG